MQAYLELLQVFNNLQSLCRPDNLPWELPLTIDGDNTFDPHELGSQISRQDGVLPFCLTKRASSSTAAMDAKAPTIQSPIIPSGASAANSPERRASPPSSHGDSEDADSTPEPASAAPQPSPQTPPLQPSRGEVSLHKRRQQHQQHQRQQRQLSERLTHRQVERKYREGINRQLELLRLVLPATQDRKKWAGKPSKGVVLANAIEYIHKLETEVEQVSQEKEQLRKLSTTMMQRRNWWNGMRSEDCMNIQG